LQFEQFAYFVIIGDYPALGTKELPRSRARQPGTLLFSQCSNCSPPRRWQRRTAAPLRRALAGSTSWKMPGAPWPRRSLPAILPALTSHSLWDRAIMEAMVLLPRVFLPSADTAREFFCSATPVDSKAMPRSP